MGNRIALRVSWFFVKAAEYTLPIIWKLLVATFYCLIFTLGFLLVIMFL